MSPKTRTSDVLVFGPLLLFLSPCDLQSLYTLWVLFFAIARKDTLQGLAKVSRTFSLPRGAPKVETQQVFCVIVDEESTVFLSNFHVFLPHDLLGKNGLNVLYFHALLCIFNIDNRE